MEKIGELLGAIHDPQVRKVLFRLHKEAAKEERRRCLEPARFLQKLMPGKRSRWNSPALDQKYMALDPEQGVFCYLLARSMRARRIIEFGTSFGVSTIYLAMAMRDNGGGVVIGTEMVEAKARQASSNLKEAGLLEFVDIRIGDARETLRHETEPVDLFLNDGFPPSALPVLKIIAPLMRPGGIIITDNVGLFQAEYRGYVEYLRNPGNGFQSARLGLNEGTEFSVRASAGFERPPKFTETGGAASNGENA